MEITVGEQERLTAGLAEVRPHLDERAWRLLLGAEARAVGRGGIKLVAGLAGLSARGAGLLQESLALTHAIGGTVLTEALYSAFGKAASPLRRTGRDNVVGVLKELAVDVASVGVTLGLEVCNRDETNVVNTARDTLARAEYLSADNVVIHLDTYHVNIEEDDFSTPVFDVGDRLGYVHIGENHRGDLGSGHLDFPAFFGALAQIDSSAVLASGLSNDLAIWRNLWDDGGDLARRAHAFISEQLEADPTAAGPR